MVNDQRRRFRIWCKYSPNVVYEKLKKVLYIEFFKAMYDMLQLALLSYINSRKYLDTDGFKFNPYGPCVAGKIIEVEPLTVAFHVDNAKSSHKDKKVVKTFDQ